MRKLLFVREVSAAMIITVRLYTAAVQVGHCVSLQMSSFKRHSLLLLLLLLTATFCAKSNFKLKMSE
jgi:hypothetical protein